MPENKGQFKKGSSPWNAGRKMSAEAKEKMRIAKLGKKRGPMSEYTKAKISAAHKGKKISSEHRENIRIAKSNIPDDTREKMRKSKLGVKVSAKARKNMSIAQKARTDVRGGWTISEDKRVNMGGKRGKLNHNWKGGCKKESDTIRKSVEYKAWRHDVFERDGYTCQECSEVGGTLNAHHIKPFATNKELRLCVDNGITLCYDCHRNIHFKREVG